MIDQKIMDRISYYLKKMKKLKDHTSRLLNMYNLFSYIVLNYNNINNSEFKLCCYNKVCLFLIDINNIKANYYYKKKIMNKLLEFKILYENNIYK